MLRSDNHPPAGLSQGGNVKESYIRFMGKISARTTGTLLRSLDSLIRDRVERVHLLISSPGGTVFHALSMFNFLQGAPFEVHTYNFGFVGSTSLVLYCSGARRFATPHARFLLYGVDLTLNAQTRLDEREVEQHLTGLKLDQLRIARVVAATTGKTEAQVIEDMSNHRAMASAEAKEYGLVNEIKSQLLPRGADLHVVTETPEAPFRPQGPTFPPGLGASRE